MGDIIVRGDNPLWFVDESTGLMEYSEGGLADQIFEIVDRKIIGEKKDIILSLIESSPAVAELAKGLKKSERLQLVFTDEVKQKIADGTYKLMKKKDVDGIFKAVVVDKKGKTRAIADLKWEEIGNGVDPAGMTAAMQGMAIQQQLRAISEQLQDMSAAMEDVLIGQHNDRLAMFLSGEAIYREALAASDLSLRKSLTSSAIMALTNASASLQASLVYEINSVCEKYDAEKGRFVGIKTDKLKEKMYLINSSFQTIHKATTLKAAIYYKEGEYQALTTVLSDYKGFLERSLPEDKALSQAYYTNDCVVVMHNLSSFRNEFLTTKRTITYIKTISRLERKRFPNGRKGLSRFKRNQFPDGAEYACRTLSYFQDYR